jgi:hypothetical protein
MNNIAEMMMEIYSSESLALRVEKIEKLKGSSQVYRDILDVNMYETSHLIRKSASDAINSLTGGDNLYRLMEAVEILTRVEGLNVKDARRRIADKLIEDNMYRF